MDAVTKQNSNFIVGLGASAGGLRALEEFFDSMPVDSGAAFVVVQHLSSNYKSMMRELLARHTTMAVHLAVDAMALAANSIYLIPPGKNLVVQNRTLYLLNQPQYQNLGRPNFPIDIFFESLAKDIQDHSIGVVLSGTGSDGSQGLMAIHEQGGITMVQDPETVEFDGMPQSALLTGVVDRVLAPGDLARSISHLIHLSLRMSPQQALHIGNRLRADVATESLQQVAQILSTGNQLDFSAYRPSTLSRRIQRRCLVAGFRDVGAYIQHLKQSSEEQAVLRDEFLINVTRFFRNRDAWAYLETKAIPQLFQRAVPGEPLRFWVTACATGEEAYSLAILLDEARRRRNQSVEIKIFATDVDEKALESASKGAYPKSIAKDVSQERLQQYFTLQETGYEVSRSLREMLIFSTHNLIQDPGFSRIHLISCRNVLIYLQPSLQHKVLTMLHFSLTAKGCLFLGESETPGALESEFVPLHQKWKIYEKLRDVRLSKTVTRKDPLRSQLYSMHTVRPKPQFRSHQEAASFLDTAIHKVLENQKITCCLVEQDSSLHHVVADALNLLKLPTGRATNNLIKMVPESLQIPLGTALRRASQSQQPIQFKDIPLTLATEEKNQSVVIQVTPHPQKTTGNVLIVELQLQTAHSSRESSLSEVDHDSADQMRALENELYLTRQNLQRTIEELEASNAEQQASNEELIASNEELQSSNEELQSVNEELHTLNAEYQSKNQQLSELNTDLDNLLQNTQVGVIFLDMELKIRRFTKVVTSVIPLVDSDVGRPLDNLSWKIDCPDLMALINQVNHQKESIEREVKHRETGQYLLLSIHPYRLETSIGDGSIITFVDIDRLKQAEAQVRKTATDLQQANELLEQRVAERTAEIKVSEERYALVLKGAGAGLWDWNVRTNELYISPSWKAMLGYGEHEIENSFRAFERLLHPDDHDWVLEAHTNHLQRRDPYAVEFRLRTKAESYCWVASTGQAVWDDEDNPIRMAGAIIDISDRKQAQEELKAIQAEYE